MWLLWVRGSVSASVTLTLFPSAVAYCSGDFSEIQRHFGFPYDSNCTTAKRKVCLGPATQIQVSDELFGDQWVRQFVPPIRSNFNRGAGVGLGSLTSPSVRIVWPAWAHKPKCAYGMGTHKDDRKGLGYTTRSSIHRLS